MVDGTLGCVGFLALLCILRLFAGSWCLLWFTTAYFSSVLLEIDKEDLLIRIFQDVLRLRDFSSTEAKGEIRGRGCHPADSFSLTHYLHHTPHSLGGWRKPLDLCLCLEGYSSVGVVRRVCKPAIIRRLSQTDIQWWVLDHEASTKQAFLHKPNCLSIFLSLAYLRYELLCFS